LEDYPVVFRTQDIDSEPRPKRLQRKPHTAQVVNWWLCGIGDSREEAYFELSRNFRNAIAARRSEGKRPFRPGTTPPILFAESTRIAGAGELAEDFVQRVLGFEWAMMTDESSLWDFHSEETNDALIAKIREVYGVDVSDIEPARVCEILERISAKRASIQ
jgi:hypothetical protein